MIDPFEFTDHKKEKSSVPNNLAFRVSQSVIHLSGASTSSLPTLGDLSIYLEAFELILQSIKQAP